MSYEGDEDEDLTLDPDDILQIIDLDDIALPNRGGGDSDDGDGPIADEEEEDNGMETEEVSAAAPTQDDSIVTFSSHADAVMCCQFSPVSKDIVITGSQDDTATVWNTKDASVLFHCTGHTDTVISVGFNQDGSLVATADMKGLVKVWRVDNGSEVWSFEVSEIEWIQWHQMAPVLLAGTKDGQVWMWKIPSGDCKTFTGHGSGASCGHFLPDGKHACVGYDDGVVKVWDLKSAELVANITGYDGHKSSVYCMDINRSGSMIITGSDDMTAKVINPTTGKVLSTFQCGNTGREEDQEDSVESVAFSATHDYAATGTLSGRLEIWDLPSKSVRHRCQHPHGIVKVKWSQKSPILYSASLDGCIRQFDARDGQLVRTWQGHTGGILDFSLSGDESLLVSTSEDHTARVFDLSASPPSTTSTTTR